MQCLLQDHGKYTKVPPKIILENQRGFMQKRKIVYNIILFQEAIHSIRANKERGVIIKIDMANSFD
jgi:hypothetical protein